MEYMTKSVSVGGVSMEGFPEGRRNVLTAAHISV
jgi:hypothetical protein